MKLTSLPNGPFPTTRWSQVVKSHQGDSEARAALDNLCRRYWRPIYSFARHSGCSPHDAEDITQAFFADLLESGYLQQADHERGRFRTFLIVHFRYFLSNHRQKEGAQKRGGRAVHLPLDVDWAESRLELSDPRLADPDVYFDRQWALDVVRHARSAVATHYEATGRGALFDALKSGLARTPDAGQYAAWERELDLSPNALRVALHRLRERLRDAIEEQILETVSSQADLKDEMRHLRRALGDSMEDR